MTLCYVSETVQHSGQVGETTTVRHFDYHKAPCHWKRVGLKGPRPEVSVALQRWLQQLFSPKLPQLIFGQLRFTVRLYPPPQLYVSSLQGSMNFKDFEIVSFLESRRYFGQPLPATCAAVVPGGDNVRQEQAAQLLLMLYTQMQEQAVAAVVRIDQDFALLEVSQNTVG